MAHAGKGSCGAKKGGKKPKRTAMRGKMKY
jgi:hypothetical protein